MGAPIVGITVTGIKEIRAKLNADLLAEPWTRVMTAMGARGVQAAKAASPKDSGRMAAAFTMKLQARPIPLEVKVLTTARAQVKSSKSAAFFTKRYGTTLTKRGKQRRGSHNNYPYPKRLEYDKSSRHFGWLRDVGKSLHGELMAKISLAAREIEARWSK